MGQQHPKNKNKHIQQKLQTQKNVKNSEHDNLHNGNDKGIVQQIFNKDLLLSKLQEFRFPDPYIKYKIVPASKDQMALDVTTIDDREQHLSQGNIIVWDYHGGPNQQFYIKKQKEGLYKILNVATNFTLAVPNNSKQENVVIGSVPATGSQNQNWDIIECGKKIYKIKTFCGKYIGIEHFRISNGTSIVQQTWQDKKYQKWHIVPG